MTADTTIPTPATDNWEKQKIKLKEKFSYLTDEDLKFEGGKKDEMMNNLQIKLGKTKDQLTTIISEL